MSRGHRHLFRHTSPEALTELFASAGAPRVAFDPKPAVRTAQAHDVFIGLPQVVQSKLQTAFVEIGALANELGEDCIRHIAGTDRAVIDATFVAMQSSYDRVAWLHRAKPEILQAALSLWFFDRRSLSTRLADAFEGPEVIDFAEDVGGLETRVSHVIADDVGQRPRVRVERYDLADGSVLVAISHEELWTTTTEFNDAGELDARARRRVHHAAAKIESGTVTVAAERGGLSRRQALALAIAEELLGLSGELARLPPVTYDLQRLLDVSPFATEPQHAITDVVVTALTLSAPSLGDARICVFTSGHGPTDVRERALARLSSADRPFALVEAAELRVIFGPGAGRSKPRIVRLSFNAPSTCKVQLDCAEEALVRSRYLRVWGLIASRRGKEGMAR